MKILLAALLLLNAGCAATRLQSFLATVPATNLAEFKHVTNSPVFQTEQKVTNVTTRPDGRLNVGGASSITRLPAIGVSDEISLTGFVQIPSPDQVAAGAAIVNARPK